MSQPQSLPLAVALEYDGQGAPRVTAKGHGVVAEKIIETAREHDIAIEQNAALAQALSTVELEDSIPEELYLATAQVIAFVLGHNVSFIPTAVRYDPS